MRAYQVHSTGSDFGRLWASWDLAKAKHEYHKEVEKAKRTGASVQLNGRSGRPLKGYIHLGFDIVEPEEKFPATVEGAVQHLLSL